MDVYDLVHPTMPVDAAWWIDVVQTRDDEDTYAGARAMSIYGAARKLAVDTNEYWTLVEWMASEDYIIC